MPFGEDTPQAWDTGLPCAVYVSSHNLMLFPPCSAEYTDPENESRKWPLTFIPNDLLGESGFLFLQLWFLLD